MFGKVLSSRVLKRIDENVVVFYCYWYDVYVEIKCFLFEYYVIFVVYVCVFGEN